MIANKKTPRIGLGVCVCCHPGGTDHPPGLFINQLDGARANGPKKPEKVKKLVSQMRTNATLEEMVSPKEKPHPFIRAEIRTNIQQQGAVLLQDLPEGDSLSHLKELLHLLL